MATVSKARAMHNLQEHSYCREAVKRGSSVDSQTVSWDPGRQGRLGPAAQGKEACTGSYQPHTAAISLILQPSASYCSHQPHIAASLICGVFLAPFWATPGRPVSHQHSSPRRRRQQPTAMPRPHRPSFHSGETLASPPRNSFPVP
jgi:hypothetical protein